MKKILVLFCCSYFFLIGCNPNTIEDTENTTETIEETIEEFAAKEVEKIVNEGLPEDPYLISIAAFISYVKHDNIQAIAEKIRYSLSRPYPLSDIKNIAEFTERYHDIFDEELKEEIITSDIKTDWNKIGSKGIMLNSGTLWLDLKGNLIAINKSSLTEIEQRISLIAKDKASLHESLKDFESPDAILETERFRIRIDEVDGKYRYASWEIDQSQSEKPDLIINGGDVIMDGSGGNHYYLFKNGDYTYRCYIIVLGENSSPLGILAINKLDENILREDIVYLEN